MWVTLIENYFLLYFCEGLNILEYCKWKIWYLFSRHEFVILFGSFFYCTLVWVFSLMTYWCFRSGSLWRHGRSGLLFVGSYLTLHLPSSKPRFLSSSPNRRPSLFRLSNTPFSISLTNRSLSVFLIGLHFFFLNHWGSFVILNVLYLSCLCHDINRVVICHISTSTITFSTVI